ncbi:TniQ family protein [Pseudoduganella sp. S-14]|jgi:hypothetical protein|uniref:TniQ family protein n=1 Tax=Pseudoduganella sp. S-14 TaxID=3404065 RepID=UPI003CF9EFF7
MSGRALPVTLKARPGESAGGYLLRTAEANGHVNVYQMLSGIGFRSHRLALAATLSDPMRYMAVAKELGIESEAQKVVLPRAGSTWASPVKLMDMIVPQAMLQNDLECFCPRCLEEEPYWRKQWLLRPLAVCVEHECLLINECSVCSKPLNLARGRLTLCGTCGTPFQSMAEDPINVNLIQDFVTLMKRASDAARSDAWSFWRAHEQFEGPGNTPAQNFRRTCLTLEFMVGGGRAVRHIASEIMHRSSGLHPRIHLVPFLTASPSCAGWAEEVISLLPPLDYPLCGKDGRITLSKTEACSVLGISQVVLETLIRKGTIKWPLGGRRQQHIAATEISEYLRSRPERVNEFETPC